MRIRITLVSTCLLVAACVEGVHSQPPVPPIEFTPPAPAQLPAPPAPKKSIDELLNDLEKVRAQKAELEKKEQELKATIEKQIEQQAERLNKLGLAPKAAGPDRIGRILIEGNAKAPVQKILDESGLHPGQILRYPTLEECRTKLRKAGIESTLDVVPNELDSALKDIRVRVSEPRSQPNRAPEP